MLLLNYKATNSSTTQGKSIGSRVFEIRFKLLGAAICFICSCPLLLHAFVAVLLGRSDNGVEAGHALEVVYHINDTLYSW